MNKQESFWEYYVGKNAYRFHDLLAFLFILTIQQVSIIVLTLQKASWIRFTISLFFVNIVVLGIVCLMLNNEKKVKET